MKKLFKQFAAALIGGFVLVSGLAQAGDSVRYLHTDHLGSPIAATTAQGGVSWYEVYQPYGKRIDRANNGQTPAAYTGKPEDAESGLVYLGARYYSPVMGRFLGVDPAKFNGEPASFNRYAYGNNNPYKYVDPDGRTAFPAIIGGVILIGGGIVAAGSIGVHDASMLPNLRLPSISIRYKGITLQLNEAADEAEGNPEAGDGVPEYARNKYGRPSKDARSDALENDPVCVYCETTPSDTVDHVRSQKQDWVEGGWRDSREERTRRINDPGNLRGACRSCNSSKADKELGTGDGQWNPPVNR